MNEDTTLYLLQGDNDPIAVGDVGPCFELREQLARCHIALRAAREAINGPQVPGFLTNEELGALELIAEALGEDYDPD